MTARKISVAAFSIALLTDAITKCFAPWDDWTFHEGEFQLRSIPILSLLFAAAVLSSWWPVSLFLAGAMGNIVWIGAAGGAPNPFVSRIPFTDYHYIAFNVADVALVIAACVVSVALVVNSIRHESIVAGVTSMRR